MNLGHLLERGYLPMPGNNSHVFYCPSMEAGGGMHPGAYGFVFASNPAEPPASQRGFDGWGVPGRPVNIGYEYRVSLPKSASATLKEATPRRKLTEAANLALVVDIISYGAGRFAHGYRHHFVRGDGSVELWADRAAPPIWQTYGLSPAQNNDALFLILDHPQDYQSYLK